MSKAQALEATIIAATLIAVNRAKSVHILDYNPADSNEALQEWSRSFNSSLKQIPNKFQNEMCVKFEEVFSKVFRILT